MQTISECGNIMGEVEIKQLENMKTQIEVFFSAYSTFFEDTKEAQQVKNQLLTIRDDIYKEKILIILEEPFWCPHCDQDEGYRETVVSEIHSDHNEYHAFTLESKDFLDDPKPKFTCLGCEKELRYTLIRDHKKRYEEARQDFNRLEITPKYMSFWERFRRGKP